jgi:Tol biopolymer transport system component
MFDQRDSTHQLVQVAVADGSVQVVKKLEDRHEISVSLSPDGRYLAFDAASQKTSSKHDIFSLSVDGSRETPLVQNPADNRLLGWTPDGKSILFATDRSGTMDAWIVPVSAGKAQGAPELVRRDLGKIRPLGFTRGGSFYYSLGSENVQDIYTATLDPETSKLIGAPELAKTRFTGKNSGLDWSPDGRYLVYRSLAFKDGDPYKLVILNPETGEEREVRTKLKSFNRPRWFPDGTSIFVRDWTRPDAHNGAGLFKINSETGDATIIAPEKPGAELLNPVLSHDAKAVFYQNKNTLWKRNLETGEDREIYRPTTPTENPPTSYFSHVFAQSIALSPDGQRLAFLLRSSAIGAPFAQSLLVIPATGGDARELLKVREPEFFADSDSNVAWTPDGRYVFFVKERGLGWQQSELWRISADGGEPQNLGQLMGRVFEVRIHPDGRRIAFTRLQWNKGAEVWVMENFLPTAQTRKGAVTKSSHLTGR